MASTETASLKSTQGVVRRRALKALTVVGISAWAIAVGAGLERIWAYSVTPGAAAASPRAWPGSGLIEPQPGAATLLMFVHPLCPCSRASVAELQVAMERAPGPVSAWVLFLRPEVADQAWESTAMWQAARKIPGVTVLTDREGGEAARFGASTSGHVVLYDANGRFLFSGGITASRGHVGDNGGLHKVLDLLDGSAPDRTIYPVFGCSLHEPNANRSPQPQT